MRQKTFLIFRSKMFLNPGEGGKGHVSEHLRAQAEDPRHHPQVSEQEESEGTKRCIKNPQVSE